MESWVSSAYYQSRDSYSTSERSSLTASMMDVCLSDVYRDSRVQWYRHHHGFDPERHQPSVSLSDGDGSAAEGNLLKVWGFSFSVWSHFGFRYYRYYSCLHIITGVFSALLPGQRLQTPVGSDGKSSRQRERREDLVQPATTRAGQISGQKSFPEADTDLRFPSG